MVIEFDADELSKRAVLLLDRIVEDQIADIALDQDMNEQAVDSFASPTREKWQKGVESSDTSPIPLRWVNKEPAAIDFDSLETDKRGKKVLVGSTNLRRR